MFGQLKNKRNYRDVEFLLLNRNDSELSFLGCVLGHLWVYVAIWCHPFLRSRLAMEMKMMTCKVYHMTFIARCQTVSVGLLWMLRMLRLKSHRWRVWERGTMKVTGLWGCEKDFYAKAWKGWDRKDEDKVSMFKWSRKRWVQRRDVSWGLTSTPMAILKSAKQASCWVPLGWSVLMTMPLSALSTCLVVNTEMDVQQNRSSECLSCAQHCQLLGEDRKQAPHRRGVSGSWGPLAGHHLSSVFTGARTMTASTEFSAFLVMLTSFGGERSALRFGK